MWSKDREVNPHRSVRVLLTSADKKLNNQLDKHNNQLKRQIPENLEQQGRVKVGSKQEVVHLETNPLTRQTQVMQGLSVMLGMWRTSPSLSQLASVPVRARKRRAEAEQSPPDRHRFLIPLIPPLPRAPGWTV